MRFSLFFLLYTRNISLLVRYRQRSWREHVWQVRDRLPVYCCSAGQECWTSDRQADSSKAPAASSESQLTGIRSVIKWTLWSRIHPVGTPVTHHARVRHNISSHHLIKAGEWSHSIARKGNNVTKNKEMILWIFLIKLPATFIKLSQCNGWTPCIAAVRVHELVFFFPLLEQAQRPVIYSESGLGLHNSPESLSGQLWRREQRCEISTAEEDYVRRGCSLQGSQHKYAQPRPLLSYLHITHKKKKEKTCSTKTILCSNQIPCQAQGGQEKKSRPKYLGFQEVHLQFSSGTETPARVQTHFLPNKTSLAMTCVYFPGTAQYSSVVAFHGSEVYTPEDHRRKGAIKTVFSQVMKWDVHSSFVDRYDSVPLGGRFYAVYTDGWFTWHR